MTDKQFKIFLDFDGTITKNDVGEEIFKKALKEDIVKKIVEDLLTNKISSRECWESLCGSVSILDKTEFDDFILSQEIEPTLHRFIEYCEANGFELFVLSDGFDYYIEKILKRENLHHLKVYSNKLILNDEGKLIPSFPYYNADCRSSANCKRNHIIENSGEVDYTVFIGDGNSDNDAIQFVDFIFAKDDLLKFCEVQRITYFPFKDFDDVIVRLRELVSKKRLKKRYQAELKRREAFMIE
ncbi:MAG: 2-hydroxy-3-keto-5-methylthiopentenyl-1-phosphate phosphatase [Ignavibacteria bacterium RBG_16_36_9]|nr:MAG: 2-hydroxy-3-keto-5-methylthiopentenyl-1-phosphate phosphatase [Ignavibacteria bacterium RBG_16_36_9]